ncbi:neural/ectodermal development factor IMP-L2 [Biomphalaria glabrata]|nr:neural/ectodermal development factor IMP-L2 [Biomphalaria glabrata]
MLTRLQSVAIIVCLVYVPQFTFALSRRLALNKRLSKHEEFLKPKLFFKSKPSEISTVLYDSIVLSCEAAGIPNPTIHWLKNGERVQQGTSHNVQDDEAAFENAAGDDLPRLQLANTVSKLYLDCITEEDEAEYTCVAETPLARKTQSHKVFIDPIRGNPRHRCSVHNGEKPARIYMATSSRFEYENELTQLYCRAEGKPTPTITWYDPFNEPITNADGYKIAKNGDLIILNATWKDHMGVFTCVADNGIGSDNATAFLYPTGRG